MESSSQDDSRSASQVPDTTKHQSSEDGFPASQVKDEDVEIEGDRKVLKEEVGKGDVAAKEEIHGEKDHDTGHEEGVVVKDESNESEFVVNEKDHDDSHEESVVVKNEPPESEIVVNEKDHDVSHEEGVLVKDEPHESESAYEEDHDDSHEEGVVLKDEHPESDFVVKEEVYDNDHEDQKQVLSYVKSRTGYEPEAKRRHVALPQKVTKKPAVKAVKEALSDKQTSLHSYFAKKWILKGFHSFEFWKGECISGLRCILRIVATAQGHAAVIIVLQCVKVSVFLDNASCKWEAFQSNFVHEVYTDEKYVIFYIQLATN